MDYRFEIGDFDSIFTDHERAYTDNPNIPLVEQILLRFGFTQEELKNIDCRPNLFFDKNEIPNPEFKKDYGCLLFATRIDKLKDSYNDIDSTFSHKQKDVIIGGNWVRDYGGFDSYLVADVYGNKIDMPKMRTVDYHEELLLKVRHSWLYMKH